ncbi:CoA transferase [Pseudoduganella sp. RAF53_2]|uniref:CoA transferase n=1 Tax=unclassified Pseudoduganella TaxID=2637179 RepID=UPI003F9D6FF0
MHEISHHLLAAIWQALDGDAALLERCTFSGDDILPSVFATSDLAVASIGAAGLALASLPGVSGNVTVSRRLASLWFGFTIQPQGWELPPAWDAVAGDYRAADRWIRLHTNAPHHRAAALAVLRCAAEREAVAQGVARWQADELEAAIVAHGGCAAAMRSLDEWRAHPQSIALTDAPLMLRESRPCDAWTWRPDAARPLKGIRVLDLTRVLAGPVATRFLAGFGAEVLRIDPPGWDEGILIPEVTLGKRCARLDLREAGDRTVFERLLAQADVLVHGYRDGALDGLGYGAEARVALNPNLIDVSLNAYGWSGPWRGRRGFDSLVQMSAGIADAGMQAQNAAKPVPLPVQALDHATGYLIAAAVIRGIYARLTQQCATRWRLSLARTARLLTEAPRPPERAAWQPLGESDIAPEIEQTGWGPARRPYTPLTVGEARMRWSRPASALGSSDPNWD